MGAGYTRQSAAAIADGNTITDTDLELEFDALEAAFHATTGHTHDATAGEGPKIALTTSISGVLPVANGGFAGIHKVNGTLAPTVNEDSGDGYAVGSQWLDTTNDVLYICLDATLGAAVWIRHQVYDADLVSWALITRAAGFDTFVATPTSANLAALLTDETGSGANVFGTSPTITSATLVTPALGTPASGVLTNATGLPISTGVSGLAANVATFLGTPSSANLAAAVTDETGSGALVFGTSPTIATATLNSPTMVTPALGTPASGVLTNATGLPISTGVSGLAAGVATFLATPSSANLISAVTDETGTGALVFATSPTLVTPALGTPASGVLTNATGLPISTGVSGLAANVATFLATPTSANLLAAVTNETGTGSLVFATSPSLVTPSMTDPSITGASTQIVSSASGQILNLESTEAGAAAGPSVLLYRNSASPAANDAIGELIWYGKNSVGGGVAYATDYVEIVDTTSTSEDAVKVFKVMRAGSLSNRMVLASGLYMSGATSNDMGSGTVNATNVYKNGIELGITAGTAQATTSGTSIDFTSIPSGVRRITLMFAGLSVNNGTSPIIVQLGDSGGVETTGYLGSASNYEDSNAVDTTNYTTGFGISGQNSATRVAHGMMVMTLLDSATNTWVASVNGGYSHAAIGFSGGGSKSLTGTLDRIRLTIANGTDSFDAGSANILYE